MLGGEEIVPSQRNLFLPIPLPDYDDESMSTTRKYLAFDLETAKITRRRLRLEVASPSRISCAATLLGQPTTDFGTAATVRIQTTG